jgi:hypothetical protein
VRGDQLVQPGQHGVDVHPATLPSQHTSTATIGQTSHAGTPKASAYADECVIIFRDSKLVATPRVKIGGLDADCRQRNRPGMTFTDSYQEDTRPVLLVANPETVTAAAFSLMLWEGNPLASA